MKNLLISKSFSYKIVDVTLLWQSLYLINYNSIDSILIYKDRSFISIPKKYADVKHKFVKKLGELLKVLVIFF